MSRLRLAKIAVPSAPPANTMELYYDTTDSKLEAIDSSSNRLRIGGFATTDYRLISVSHLYTGTLTFTPNSQTRALFVQALGGGGGGGGALNGATNAAGGGGGAGSYAEGWIVTGVAGHGVYTVAVGAAGAAAAAGNNAGGNGGSTQFDTGPVQVQGNGGTGGAGSANVAAPNIGGAGGAGGTDSALPADVVGGFSSGGAPGDIGVIQSATVAFSGKGGDSIWGGGGIQRIIDAVGLAGTGYGAGGGGAQVLNSGVTARSGGAGTAGIQVIWEYA